MDHATDTDTDLDTIVMRFPPIVVAEVMTFYERHGWAAAVKRFPDVRVNVLIERHVRRGLVEAYPPSLNERRCTR